ncbi:MAG TPA: STN domain-containing protein, partial [Niabella sp.]
MSLKQNPKQLLFGIDYKKILLVMKLSAFLILATCLQASATGYAQITIVRNHAPLKSVLRELRQKSGYDILWNTDILQHTKNVKVSIYNETVAGAMEKILENQDLSFVIVDKTIILKKRPDSEQITRPV